MAEDRRTQRIAELEKEARMHKAMGNRFGMFACWRQIDSMAEIHPATRRYAAALEARTNYEALNSEHVLRCRLEDQGYNIREFDELFDELIDDVNT
jgi:hypothetical protein